VAWPPCQLPQQRRPRSARSLRCPNTPRTRDTPRLPIGCARKFGKPSAFTTCAAWSQSATILEGVRPLHNRSHTTLSGLCVQKNHDGWRFASGGERKSCFRRPSVKARSAYPVVQISPALKPVAKTRRQCSIQARSRSGLASSENRRPVQAPATEIWPRFCAMPV
jgi:hypothetical protein